MIDCTWLALRAAGFVLSLQAAGTGLFLGAFGARLVHSSEAVRRAGARIALAAFAVCLAQLVIEAPHLAGDWAGLTDAHLLRIAVRSSVAEALLARTVALACVAAAFGGGSAAARRLGLLAGLAVPASYLLTGHTATQPGRALLATLLFAHLSVVAFWLGSLRPLSRVARFEPRAAAGALIGGFSATAVWLVPGMALAGVSMAALLLPQPAALWREPYGRLLSVKVALFVLLMALAALNRQRLAPAMSRGEIWAVSQFRRSVAAEYLLICATLAVTAAMTGLYSPGQHSAAVLAPPGIRAGA
jgi:putative copper export protein